MHTPSSPINQILKIFPSSSQYPKVCSEVKKQVEPFPSTSYSFSFKKGIVSGNYEWRLLIVYELPSKCLRSAALFLNLVSFGAMWQRLIPNLGSSNYTCKIYSPTICAPVLEFRLNKWNKMEHESSEVMTWNLFLCSDTDMSTLTVCYFHNSNLLVCTKLTLRADKCCVGGYIKPSLCRYTN